MSMHLEGPWLSTTGKRKGKQKFASADAKRKSEQLDKEWQELQKRWGVEADERKRRRAMEAEPLSYSLSVPAGRSTAHIKSLGQDSGVATLAQPKVYTGTKVKGIATMHKSNAVPVFSDEQAIDISKMRR
jgi:N-acetylglucosamine-6-phosphate deacetylase